MGIKEKISTIFPKAEAIPPDLRKGLPFDQDGYLCDGRLHRWQGPMQEVSSPIFVREADAQTPLHIGSYPMLTETEALKALDAAVTAYDHGRGQWPTMSVAERIHIRHRQGPQE